MTYEGESGTADAARREAAGVASTARDEAGSVATVAKDEAQQVTGAAREEARHVADTAREQAGEVVGEAKDRARDVVGDVREELRRRADEQGARAAGALHETGRQLRSMADSGEDNVLTGVVSQAAQQVEQLASRLDDGGVERVLDDVRSFARRKPGTFLLAAGAAGFVIGRLARNVNGLGGDSRASADAPGSSGLQQYYAAPTSPSPPLPGLGVDTTIGTGADPTLGGGGDSPIPSGTEMPYVGGATPPADVYGEGPR
jgi:hypothetical protein